MRWTTVALSALLIFAAEQKECFAQTSNSSAKQETIVCAQPIFFGLHRLREVLAEEPEKLKSVTVVSLFLLKKYCVATRDELTPSRTEKIDQYCDMHTDTTHAGTSIFWETCRAGKK